MHFESTGPNRASKHIIVALDSTAPKSLLPLVDRLLDVGIQWFKVGLATWLAGGRQFVLDLKERGALVFLDLKFHDIPHQVGLAAEVCADLGVDLTTVHASGGPEMIQAAVQGAGPGCRVVAVTVLTSLESSVAAVTELADAACSAGAHGVVCSPQEVGHLRQTLGRERLIVTPGIRPTWAGSDDQRRIATPKSALVSGSDLLVVGRPITQAADPLAAAVRLLSEC